MEDIKFLKELQKELREQDRDVQASPRFWVVGDYREVTCLDGEEDSKYISFMDRDFSGSFDYIKENITDIFQSDEEYSVFLENKEENGEIEDWEDDDIIDFFETEFGDEITIVPVRVEHYTVPNTFFITKEEAREHIRLNHYHYTPRVHTYAMTALRAPKVERLWSILENFDWDSVEQDG